MADHPLSPTTIVPLEQRPAATADPRKLLKIEHLLREHGRSVARTYFPTLRAGGLRDTPERRALLEAEHRDALEAMLAGAASMSTLEAISDAPGAALGAEPDEGVIEGCLAALIDTRVRVPHNLPIYLEALIYDLRDEGFPPAVVAAACQRIRRESKFLPEISEVLTTCRETLARYREQQQRVSEALVARRKAERWLSDMTCTAQDPVQ
ncbi:hypothetical protein [Methylobacterium tardum]|uniref:hypothetical protein n=1 Tax=Methylobacterium tardum TaxID=374432 RepID=UPI00360EB833